MEILNKKIDIRQVIIAPVYEIRHDHTRIDMNNPFKHKNKWVALFPIVGTGFKSFYNLSDNFNQISTLSKQTRIGEEFVNLEESTLLIDYLEDSKYLSDKRYMSYRKLLYLIVPITQFEKYKRFKEKDINITLKKGRTIVKDVVYKDDILYSKVLKKQKHFAVDIEENIPVSFKYINDEIPYVKRRIK